MHFGRFANHDTHTVVDKHATPDKRTGMNFDAREKSRQVRHPTPRALKAATPQCIRNAMETNGMKPRVREPNVEPRARGRVLAANGLNIFADAIKHE